jgi:mono/diheme cytochrome c family protein
MIARLPVFACCATIFLLGFGCDRLPGKPTPADVVLKPGQVHDFATLFHQNCAGCHGLDGKGNAALALANPVYFAMVSDDTLRRATAEGVPGTHMPPFAQSKGGDLTDEQINILVREMRARWSSPGALQGVTLPPYAASAAGDAHHGHEVFVTFCTACHGTDGKGTSKIGSIVDGSYLALVSDQSLRTTIIAGRPDLGHPDWRNCVSNRVMTAEEVTDVVAWLVAQRSPTPGQPYPQQP